MTVKQVGRPSKVQERTAEILRATVAVVAREGLAGVTFAKVAEEAGLQRTLVLHYFGSREQLLSAFIDHAMGDVGTEILHRGSGEHSLRDRVAMMLAPGAYQRRDDLVVWKELVTLSARDPEVAARMRKLWDSRWLPDLEVQLADGYPGAPPDVVAASAYALACLFEGHWGFSLQGVADDDRTQHVQRAAMTILDQVEGRAPWPDH